MTQNYSIIGFENTSVIIIEQENKKIKKLYLQSNIHVEKITTYGTFEYNGQQYFYTGSFDKTIKFWIFENEKLKLINSSVLQKKVTHSFYSKELNSHFVTDKYGDIYEFKIEKILKETGDLFPIYQNSNNLAIQQSFKDITINEETSFCVLGDSYSKIKLFDLRNMHDLFNLWIPFESHLVEILEFDENVIFLFQMKDSETLEKRFIVHQLEKIKFLKSEYEGEKLEQITFGDNIVKVRMEKKNNEEFVIWSINKNNEIVIQSYNIIKKSLVDNQKSHFNVVVGADQKDQNKIYFHLSYLKECQSSLAIVGIKQNTNPEFVLADVNLSESKEVVVHQLNDKSQLLVLS